MNLAIQIKNLEKTYQSGTKALQGVSLDIHSGDFYGLLGANGAGKTTLISTLTSLVQKTKGSVHINGVNIDEKFPLAKTYMGVVPQEFNFNIFEKVIDIVCYQAGFYGISKKEAVQRAEPILKRLQLWHKKDEPSKNLSGGMKRRLMIARALIHNPQILILDEPTAGVDVELRVDMWEYLKELNQNGLTILLTTHYLEEAEQLTNKIAIIKNGKIIKDEPTKQLLKNLQQEVFCVEFKILPTPEILKKLNLKPTKHPDSYEVVISQDKSISDFMKQINNYNLEILNFRPNGNRLEQLYLQITSSNNA